MNLDQGEILKCPHCGKYPDGDPYPVEVFTTKGRRTTNECGSCDGEFVVQEDNETYQVTKTD